MKILSDIEIAQSCTPQPITAIARTAGVDEQYLELYGNYKAKVDYRLLREVERPEGKLVLVTAINPTPAGEGKTTTTVGLADGLRRLGQNAMVALREPSMGPVFGVKGGAAGGGWAQVIPMEDINLHFTGDFHAIGAANNLLAAMLDNHIQQGNALGIDPKRITWRRCVDMNDRQLRNIVDGLGGRVNGCPREDGFDITVASEIMAVLCLASDLMDLKARLGSALEAAYADGYRHFLCGMALGCDLYFCEAALDLRDRYEDVTVEAAVPCEEQCARWRERDQNRYFALLERCDYEARVQHHYTPGCMQRRDRYMVDRSQRIIAAYDGRSMGGTLYTLTYALRQGLETVILDL